MIAGTTGESRRLEALRFPVAGTALTGGVLGQRARAEHRLDGLEGVAPRRHHRSQPPARGRPAQADQSARHDFDLAYRVHVQSIGWMPWVQNGAIAGTTGRGLRIEAIQIRLLDKTP